MIMTTTLVKREFPDSLVEAVSQNYDFMPDENLASGILPSFIREAAPNGLQIAVPTLFYLDESRFDFFADDLTIATSEAVAELRRQYTRFEILQLLLARSVGTPMSIQDVREGRILQDIIPKECKQGVADSSHGSAIDFSLHNDMSYLEDEQIPDYFSLGCIRNSEEAVTTIADPALALKLLDDDSVSELRKAHYIFRHTYHRGGKDERIGEKVSPVVTANGEVRLGVDMEAPTAAAHDALTNFRAALGSVSLSHVLKSGQVLVIPNRHFVHGRRAFSMDADPAQRRWIQRINIARNAKI